MALRTAARCVARSALYALIVALFATTAAAETVTGLVRDAQSGVPLRNMVVAVYTSAGTLFGNVTTDVSGHYEITVPAGAYRALAYDPTGAYATQFDSDAASFEESPVLNLSGGQTANVNFGLRRGGVVAGLVLTSVGLRPGMTVAAYNLSGTRRGFTTTNSTGAYSIVLPPGDYKIVAYDDAGTFAPAFFRDRPTFTEAEIVTVVAGRTMTGVDLFLQAGARASGRIADASGAPLANVAVLAYDVVTGRFAAVATTGSDGRYTMTLLPGTYRFVAIDNRFTYAAGYLNGAASFETSPAIALAANQQRGDLSFVLEPGGRVQGTVVDASGKPIAGVTVAAFNLDGTLRTFVTTDANGRYVLLLPDDTFRIGVFDPNLAYTTQFYPLAKTFGRGSTISVSPAQTMTLAPFIVERGGRISGVITDQLTGLRQAGAVVAAYNTSGELIATAVTSLAGVYHLVLPPGPYKLVAFDPQLRFASAFPGAPNFDTSRTIDVTVDREVVEDFSLRRGTLLSGTVVDELRRPVAGVEVTALDLNQNRVGSAVTAADGTFRIPLLPGTYKFIAVDTANRYKTAFFGGATFVNATAVTVDATSAPRVTITVQPPGKRRAVSH